jgi:threonine synthase
VGKFLFGCAVCGEKYSGLDLPLTCGCGHVLKIIETPSFSPSMIETENTTLWRYSKLIAPEELDRVTLGEGWTPLISIRDRDFQIYAKLESLNPTGSFKDRAAALLVSITKTTAKRLVHDDSSGNAGAALAAYCAAAGIKAHLFVPAYAAPAKLAQIELFGAKLIPIAGKRRAATQAALAYHQEGLSHYLSHAHNPLVILANKSIAFELWEQFNGQAPQMIVMPVGQGTQLLGVRAGFEDLLKAGLIPQLPVFVAVQAAACAPVAAYSSGVSVHKNEAETVAEGIRISHPTRLADVFQASDIVITVEENQIQIGLIALAQRGISAEPTSAVVWAAWEQIRDTVDSARPIVLIITGHGLKTPDLGAYVSLQKFG